MNTQNLTEFQNRVAHEAELQQKVRAIHEAAAREAAEKIAAISAEAGLPFTADELLASIAPRGAELSDEQLEAVAGGVWEASAGNVALSIFTLGAGCLAAFNASFMFKQGPDDCQPDATKPRRSGGYD